MNATVYENRCQLVRKYKEEAVEKSIYYHQKCDSEYHIVSNDDAQEIICPRCKFYENQIEKDKEAKEKLDRASNSQYIYQGIAYKDNKAAIPVLNVETGNFFLNNNLDNLVNKGNKDPYLNINKYEEVFFKFITESGITTDPFKTISIKRNEMIRISKNSQPYRVDFSLNILNQPILAIEIDGPHHYKQIKLFDSYSSLTKRISRDLNKDAYLCRNFIPLLRLTPCRTVKVPPSPENVISLYQEEFIAKVIGHPDIIKRNLDFLLNPTLNIDHTSATFSYFINSLQSISHRTNPFAV